MVFSLWKGYLKVVLKSCKVKLSRVQIKKKPARKNLAGITDKRKTFLFYLGVTFFLKLGVDNIAALGFGLARHRKTIIFEFPVFNKRTVIRGVVFVLIAVLFLLRCLGFVDLESAA